MNLRWPGKPKNPATVPVPLCPSPALFRPAQSRNCARRVRFSRCPIYRLPVPGSRAVYVLGLRVLPCWDCGFESRRGTDVCLLWLMCVVRYRPLRRAWPPVQRIPTECVESLISKPQQCGDIDWRGIKRLKILMNVMPVIYAFGQRFIYSPTDALVSCLNQ